LHDLIGEVLWLGFVEEKSRFESQAGELAAFFLTRWNESGMM
jgi:hypothetical protein